eukprot:3727997-Rhodomonas_salina.1
MHAPDDAGCGAVEVEPVPSQRSERQPAPSRQSNRTLTQARITNSGKQECWHGKCVVGCVSGGGVVRRKRRRGLGQRTR